jgi:diacylglycerol kinase
MNRLYNLRKSFMYAFSGIAFCIRYERNMRIHMVATFFVLWFAGFYDLAAAEWGLLIMTCTTVMALEVVNTAIEVLTDKASPERSALAKVAKDAAAGAVLLASIAAIAVGALLLWDVPTFREIARFYSEIHNLVSLILMVALAITFVFTGKERRNKRKKDKSK